MNRVTFPVKCSPEDCHRHVGGFADAHRRGQRFRNRNPQPQDVDLRQLHHRRRIVVRRTSLHQRASIGVAPGDHAIERRGDARVVRHGRHLAVGGLRHLQLLPRSRERRLRRLDLRFRCAVFGLGVVQFLLRNQARTRLGSLRQPHRVGVQRVVLRLVARDFILGALNFLLTVPHSGSCALATRASKFRYFQHGQHLASLHPVADVDIDLADIARQPWRASRSPGREEILLRPRRCFRWERAWRWQWLQGQHRAHCGYATGAPARTRFTTRIAITRHSTAPTSARSLW